MSQGFLRLAHSVQATADRVDILLPETARQRQVKWPDGCISVNGKPTKFHLGQVLAYNSDRRNIAMIAGTQGGKTSFVPWWLWKEIRLRGAGDYLAVTAAYDMFKLKFLPAMLECFESILKVGRYWTGDRIIELRHPTKGFLAKKSQDVMWGRIILRSAESPGGLESASALAAVCDEAGQDGFTIAAYRAIKRRIALNRGRILFSTTLYSPGWLEHEIMSPAEESGSVKKFRQGEAELWVTDSEKVDTTLIQYDSILNPEYPMEEFEEAKETLPDDQFNMQYRGRVGSHRTLIYDCFDPAKHVVEPFEIPGNWQRWLGLDFGGTNTAGIFFAQDPMTGEMYGYRLYKEGKKSVAENVVLLKTKETQDFAAFGGDPGSEDSWRKEFGRAGLYVNKPPAIGLEVGIQRVYAAKKKNMIYYFDTLWPIINENLRYKRKVDDLGNVLDDIVAKKTFHFLDAERYILSYVMASAGGLTPRTRKYA